VGANKKKQGNARKATQTVACSAEQGDEYGTFSKALAKVLMVSHDEMKKRITKDSVVRASREKH
jgi:hypothetical protein